MPRNSFGVYSLPSGNPVVADTIIEASGWANPTLDDIGSEITGSLPRNGTAGMTAALKIADGSVSAPGLSFTAAANTGMWRNSSNIAWSIAGTKKLELSATSLDVTGNFSVSGTTSFTGSVTFTGTIAAAGATLTGALSGTTATFSGAINANGATLTAGLTGTTGTFSGLVTAGSVSAASVTASGAVQGATVVATASMTTVDMTVSGYEQHTATTGMKLPAGTTGQRSGSPNAGDIRLNTTTGLVEYWTGSAWSTLTGSTGGSGITARQSIQSGPLDSSGQPNALKTGSGLRPSLTGMTTDSLVLASAAGFGSNGAIDNVEVFSSDITDPFGADLPANNTSFIYRSIASAWGQTLIPPQYGEVYDRTKNVLMHFEGTNTATTTTDDYGNTWTANGNAQISTAQFKVGSSATLLDGTGDFWQNTEITTLTNESWTIEGYFRWVTLPTAGTKQGLFSLSNAGNFGIDFQLDNTAGTTKLNVYLSSNGTSYDIVSNGLGTSTTWATGTWYHLAIVYDALAGKYFMYKDGVQDYTLTSALTVCVGTKARIGRASATNDLNGYIDEFRITIGACRYPNGTTFTPYTTARSVEGHFFSIPKMKMYEATAASASAGTDPTLTARDVLYIGEADTSGAAVTAVRTYGYRGRYESPGVTPATAGTAQVFSHNLGSPLHYLDVRLVLIAGKSVTIFTTQGEVADLSTNYVVASVGRGTGMYSTSRNSVGVRSATAYEAVGSAGGGSWLPTDTHLFRVNVTRRW